MVKTEAQIIVTTAEVEASTAPKREKERERKGEARGRCNGLNKCTLGTAAEWKEKRKESRREGRTKIYYRNAKRGPIGKRERKI